MMHGAVITGEMVRKEAMALKKGKTCAEDRIVSEMLHLLDNEAYDEIALAFNCRLRNVKIARDDPTWGTHLVALVRKKAGASKPF